MTSRVSFRGRRQFLRGAFLSYLGIGISVLSGILVTPLLVNHLGKSEYALFSLSISVVALLTFDLGLNSAVARFVARAEARNDRDATLDALAVVRSTYLILDLLLLSVSALVWWKAPTLFPALSDAEVGQFRLLFALAGVVMLFNFPLYPANGTLQGLGLFGALRGSDVAWRVASVALSLVIVWGDLSSFWLVLGWTAIALAASIYRVIVCAQQGVWAWRIHGSPTSGLRREIRSYTSWSFLVALGQRLMITVMPAVLAATAGTHAVAIFAIAAMFESYVWLIANALNGMFLPHVAQLVQAEDRMGIEALMELVGRFQLLVLGLVIGGFAAFGRQFVQLWLGPGFEDVYFVALLLILPSLIIHTQEVAMTAVIARGAIRLRGIATAIAATVNLALAVVLTPRMGALGGAISVSTGSLAGYVLAMNIAYARAMGLDVKRFFQRVHMRILPLAILCTAAFLTISNAGIGSSVNGLLICATCFSFMYGGGAWILVLTQQERKLIRGALARLRSGRARTA